LHVHLNLCFALKELVLVLLELTTIPTTQKQVGPGLNLLLKAQLGEQSMLLQGHAQGCKFSILARSGGELIEEKKHVGSKRYQEDGNEVVDLRLECQFLHLSPPYGQYHRTSAQLSGQPNRAQLISSAWVIAGFSQIATYHHEGFRQEQKMAADADYGPNSWIFPSGALRRFRQSAYERHRLTKNHDINSSIESAAFLTGVAGDGMKLGVAPN